MTLIVLAALLVAVPGISSGLSNVQVVSFEGLIARKVVKQMTTSGDVSQVQVTLLGKDVAYQVTQDDTTRLLFMDEQFEGREVRLTAQLIPGTKTLKVKKVQTVVAGKVFDVDYWCERCQLAATEPGKCRCCGDNTVLRELPAK